MTSFIENNIINHGYQSRYRKQHSTLTILLKLWNDIKKSYEKWGGYNFNIRKLFWSFWSVWLYLLVVKFTNVTLLHFFKNEHFVIYMVHCMKSVRIWSSSGPYSIQSECGKIRTRITPDTDTFYAVVKNLFCKLIQTFLLFYINYLEHRRYQCLDPFYCFI